MKSIVTIWLLILAPLAKGQVELYLQDFTVEEVQNHAQITFTTKSGFTCEDIVIRHGTDSLDLKQIHIYPGICGSTSEDVTYTYLFKSVALGQTNYFQIDLGQYGISEIESIKTIRKIGLQPIVFPNPVQNNSMLSFSNVGRELATISIYKSTGNQVGETIETYGESVLLSDFKFPGSGIYFYTIRIKGIERQGKFLIL